MNIIIKGKSLQSIISNKIIFLHKTWLIDLKMGNYKRKINKIHWGITWTDQKKIVSGWMQTAGG